MIKLLKQIFCIHIYEYDAMEEIGGTFKSVVSVGILRHNNVKY